MYTKTQTKTYYQNIKNMNGETKILQKTTLSGKRKQKTKQKHKKTQ